MTESIYKDALGRVLLHGAQVGPEVRLDRGAPGGELRERLEPLLETTLVSVARGARMLMEPLVPRRVLEEGEDA